MARTRRAKPQLTESWDAVDDSEDERAPLYSEGDERDELGDSYKPDSVARSTAFGKEEEDQATPLPNGRPSRSGRATLANGNGLKEETPRRRNVRSAREPEFIMPSSPDGGRPRAKQNLRASTPHFRNNQRSLTSDAGVFRSTPGLRWSSQLDGTSDETSGESELQQYPQLLWSHILAPILGYTWSVATTAWIIIAPFFKYGLAIWAIIGLLIFARNFLTDTVNNALSPICRIPFTSYLNLPFCPDVAMAPAGAAEFDKLIEAQSSFEEVLSASAGGASLPLDMKRSEASIRDLKHVVQYSTLPSRNELVFEFSSFIETARQASSDLSKFNSRIGRAVDHILSTNRWTLQVIDGVAAKDASRGRITGWVSDNLNVFAPFQPVALSRDVLLDQYLRHTSAVEEQIMLLIQEAQALLNILDNLDGRLDVIAGIATRDGIKAQDNRDELFAYLWTKLGGNRSSVAKLNQQLELLKDVGAYRRLAWAHVTGTIVKLQAIRDNLEDLRERVAVPEIVGNKVPLEVHIDNINLGIQRLEAQRDHSRQIEADNYARVVGRSEAAERMIEGREV